MKNLMFRTHRNLELTMVFWKKITENEIMIHSLSEITSYNLENMDSRIFGFVLISIIRHGYFH